MISIDTTVRPDTPPTEAPETGTPVVLEYSPGATLADRHGRCWLVTSYRTTAYLDGTPPFEAWDIARAWRQFGPFSTVDAAGHKLVHPKAQPGCQHCPPTHCRCGDLRCTDFAVHRIPWAASETTAREVAA